MQQPAADGSSYYMKQKCANTGEMQFAFILTEHKFYFSKFLTIVSSVIVLG